MAETTTYNTLVAAIQTYTEDDTSRLTGEIPAIIARAADRIQMDSDIEIFDQTVSANLAYNSRNQTVPQSWLRIRSIYLQDFGTHLEQRSTQYIDALGPNVMGQPRYFDGRDIYYVVGPIPDQNYRVGVTYIGRLSSLSVTNQTNWLTINVPRLILYGCLSEAERILVSPSQTGQWEQAYGDELARQMKVLRGDERRDYMPIAAAASRPMPMPVMPQPTQ